MPVRTPKTDKRLLGEWKSDRARTMRDFAWPRKPTPARRKRFASIFGRMVVRYTRSKIHVDLMGQTSSQKYRTVASDSSSAVIAISGGWLQGEEVLTQVHFEGDHYWILMFGSHQREWFKRVKPRSGKKRTV
jgi:hypothetical protein